MKTKEQILSQSFMAADEKNWAIYEFRREFQSPLPYVENIEKYFDVVAWDEEQEEYYDGFGIRIFFRERAE